MTLPTYEEGPPDPNPPFELFSSSRFLNYPYTLRHNLTGRRSPRAWRALNLENEHLKCTVLPDLGGHLYGCRDKTSDAEVFYANPSIKFARIAYRGAWTALGIEFNFPVSHNWMTASPVDFATTTSPDGSAAIWIGNIDRAYGMQWRVKLSLAPGEARLRQDTTLYNRSDTRHRFYWWTNAAVEARADSRILYPQRFTASHGFRDVDTWPVDSKGTDLSVVGNHAFGPVSRFSHGSREPWMAVYHPRTGTGVVHYSSPLDLPAKKIWSWGHDADGMDWRKALSDNGSAYVEIQARLFRNQETYGFLEPQQSIQFSETWIPIRGLDGVSKASADAVVHLARGQARDGRVALTLRMNVAKPVRRGRLWLGDGPRAVADEPVDVRPGTTLERVWPDLPASAAYCVRLIDANGATLLEHIEGGYDLTPDDQIAVGPRSSREAPSADRRTEDDVLWLGDQLERNGQRLAAFSAYEDGLVQYPESTVIRRALGRLALVLKRYDVAHRTLQSVVSTTSNDGEALYYLGLAQQALGQPRAARLSLEMAQQYGTFRPGALFALAALDARTGSPPGYEAALDLLARLVSDEPLAVRAGAMRIALLRTTGRTDAAGRELDHWLAVDPTSSALRVEAVRAGRRDESLWAHLAGDPERILEIVVDELRFGLTDDALALLERSYPTGADVVAEPGMPHPSAYPLIAYYRGFAYHLLGRDEESRAAFDEARRLPTSYVFPNRHDTFAVLRAALDANPDDASAHLLNGSLWMSGGDVGEATRAWERALALDPGIPTLHRNLGLALLDTGGPADKAVEILASGAVHDPANVGLYLDLDRAMVRAGRSAAERVRAIERFPDQAGLPTLLVFRLAAALADSGRFDDAERQLAGRFFAREEGGTNVREIWLDVRVKRALAAARAGRCGEARELVAGLAQPVPGFPFTSDGLEAFLRTERFQSATADVDTLCRGR